MKSNLELKIRWELWRGVPQPHPRNPARPAPRSECASTCLRINNFGGKLSPVIRIHTLPSDDIMITQQYGVVTQRSRPRKQPPSSTCPSLALPGLQHSPTTIVYLPIPPTFAIEGTLFWRPLLIVILDLLSLSLTHAHPPHLGGTLL
ncbi:hypothetical protein VTO42DRAFT_6474 [Malbranchea cinnamomea]